MTESGLPANGIPDVLRTAIVQLQLDTNSAISDFSWDDTTQLLSIHYIGDQVAADKASAIARSAFPSGTWRLVSDKFDHQALAKAAITAVDLMRNAGVDVASVFPQSDNSGLRVRVLPGVLSRSTLSDLLKPLEVPVVIEFVPSKPALAGGRLNDNAPFYGGNRIYETSGSAKGYSCTGGFTVNKGSTEAFLTADHCGNPGDKWVAGTNSSGNPIGTMSDGNSGGSDFIKLTGYDYGATVWIGEIGDTTRQAVKGSFNAAVGDSVCVDGSYSGQRCGMKVTNSDGVICPTSCYNNEVDIATASHAGNIQGGDSGSPALVGATGGLKVGGVLTALNPDAKSSSCVNGSGGPCYYEGWYAAVRAFLSHNSGWSVSTS